MQFLLASCPWAPHKPGPPVLFNLWATCVWRLCVRGVMDLRTDLSLFQTALSIINLGCVDLSCSRAKTHPTSLQSWPSSSLSSIQSLTLGKVFVFASLGDRQGKQDCNRENSANFYAILGLVSESCGLFSSAFLLILLFNWPWHVLSPFLSSVKFFAKFSVHWEPSFLLPTSPSPSLYLMLFNWVVSRMIFPLFILRMEIMLYFSFYPYFLFLFLSLKISWNLKSMVSIVHNCKVWCML